MHIAIILDGNRRYAKKLGLNLMSGHEQGARKAVEALEWMKELNIDELTLYALSTENLKRSPPEVAALMMLFRNLLSKAESDPRLTESGVRVRFIGNLALLPQDIQEQMRKIEEATSQFTRHRLNLAVAYGGRSEITEAARALAREAKQGRMDAEQLTEEEFAKHLYLTEEPDILIRPGGEQRTSNFLLWQTAYTEFVFLDKLWPEIEKQDITSCIREYENRQRRKGL